jgi:hypothetical protein
VISALKRIIADGHRAAAIIESISANFKRDPHRRSQSDLNGLISETPSLVRTDLQRQGIDVRIELAPYLPQMGRPRHIR